MINPSEVLEILKKIETGEVTLDPDFCPDIGVGTARYTASNGWKFAVFNDASEWDYIQEVSNPKGESFGPYDFLDDPKPEWGDLLDRLPPEIMAWEPIRDYRPPLLAVQTKWWMPGTWCGHFNGPCICPACKAGKLKKGERHDKPHEPPVVES